MKYLFFILFILFGLMSCKRPRKDIVFTELEKTIMVYEVGDSIKLFTKSNNDTIVFLVSSLDIDYGKELYDFSFPEDIYFEEYRFKLDDKKSISELRFVKQREEIEMCLFLHYKYGLNSCCRFSSDTISIDDSIVAEKLNNSFTFSFQKGITKIVLPNDTLTVIED